MLKATVDGLKRLRRPEDVARIRGLTISQVLPYSPPPAEEPAPADLQGQTPEGSVPTETPEAE
jgi:hypothetical protein